MIENLARDFQKENMEGFNPAKKRRLLNIDYKPFSGTVDEGDYNVINDILLHREEVPRIDIRTDEHNGYRVVDLVLNNSCRALTLPDEIGNLECLEPTIIAFQNFRVTFAILYGSHDP